MKKWCCRLSGGASLLLFVASGSLAAGAGEAKPAPASTQNTSGAASQIKAEPPQKETATPDKPYEYGGFWSQPTFKPGQPEEWWENSSFDYSPEYPYLLKHIATKMAYARLTGSSDGSITTGSAVLNLRLGRFSNVLSYDVDKKYIKDISGYVTFDRDMQTFEETVKYDLNRFLYAETGMLWRRMSTVMIKDRYVPFIGVGTYNILDCFHLDRKDRLGIETGFGKVYDTYDSFIANAIGNDTDSYKAIYLRADYTHVFNKSLSYKQNLLYKNGLDKTAVYKVSDDWSRATVRYYNLRYDWRWSNALEYNFNRFIGAFVSYEVTFDSNPYPTSAKRDTTFMVGWRLMY